MQIPSLLSNFKMPGKKSTDYRLRSTATPQPVPTPETKPKSSNSVQDVVAPKTVEVDFDYAKINNQYFRTLFVAGYPRFVYPGWLDPIINFDHSLDVSFFVYPVQGKTVLDDLRRKITEMEAEIATDIQRGKILNPSTEAKLEDARGLQEQLVRGAERFFQFSFYITIPALNLEELNNITAQVESTLGSLLAVAKKTTLRMEDGFLTTLPLGEDRLSITRNMDTTSLATTFPFSSAELSSDRGVLYGINEDNDSLVVFDRFSLENYNSVVFATSGAGKSVSYRDPVLYKDAAGKIKLEKIGKVIEKAIKNGDSTKIDEEMEGVIDPGIEVYAFDKHLKGKWSKVSLAARKISPSKLYKIVTKSGREVTITADHNLVVLRNGKVQTLKGDAVCFDDYIPLSRHLTFSGAAEKFLDTKKLLGTSKIKHIKFPHNTRVGGRLWKAGTSIPIKLPLTEQFFRFLGYFVSEGMINHQRVLITNSDQVLLKDVQDYFRSIQLNCSFVVSGSDRIGIHTFFEPFRELIKKIGAAGKSATKRVPPLVFSADTQQASSFLRAYFEGDGGVDGPQISASTKSNGLASDLAYLLLRFGVIARIRVVKKKATNGTMKRKVKYYQIAISGQENIGNFIKHIGFVSKRKNDLATSLLKNSNTNVDVVPGLGTLLEDIYRVLYSSTEIPAPKKFSEIKLGVFKPSRQELLRLVKKIEERVLEVESLETDGLLTIRSLPTLGEILKKAKDKKINGQLWQNLSSSWSVMKKETHPPLLANALCAANVTHQTDYSVPMVSSLLHRVFKATGESLRSFDGSLWSAVVSRSGNTGYDRVIRARDYISERYEQKKKDLEQVKQHLTWLRILASSDLFWDPIVEVKKIKSKHKYVYDLTVDDQVFLAGFGGMFVHNSFAVKLEALRSLMFGTEVFIIDPEQEYKKLAEAVGGEYISFSFNSPAKINPFDLSSVREEGPPSADGSGGARENQLAMKILSLHSLFGVIMGTLNPSEQAVLDRALVATYKAKGITPDPATQVKQPPLMEDLYKTLIGMEDAVSRSLADRLEKFVRGSFAGIFDQYTNINLNNPFTVFSVRDLEEALRPIAMFVILDFIWTRVKETLKKRILIVDEAWHMMKYPDTAQFLYSVAKRSRKYFLGLTTITQDVEDFLSLDIGKAIITNSALKLLMKQSPAAIDRVGEVFKLSQGERQLLLASDVGEGIFFAGANHVAIRVVASSEEHKLITSNPAEVVKQTTRPQSPATPQAAPASPPLSGGGPIYKVEEE